MICLQLMVLFVNKSNSDTYRSCRQIWLVSFFVSFSRHILKTTFKEERTQSSWSFTSSNTHMVSSCKLWKALDEKIQHRTNKNPAPWFMLKKQTQNMYFGQQSLKKKTTELRNRLEGTSCIGVWLLALRSHLSIPNESGVPAYHTRLYKSVREGFLLILSTRSLTPTKKKQY